MTEKENNVVNLFGNETQGEASPETIALDSQMQERFSSQNELIRKMVLASYKVMDEVASEQDDVKPLVHMPIEAGFSLASTYISIVGGKTEEQAKEMFPLVQELSNGIDKAIEEFYTKNGENLPNEIMYYGLINAAVNALHHERTMFNFTDITGESPFPGGTN